MPVRVRLDSFLQIALVVDDIESAVDAWAAILGIERPEVHLLTTTPESATRLGGVAETYRGDHARYTIKFAMIKCPERGFIIELHEPDDNPSTFREFLDTHGNGVHHLGFNVGTDRDLVIERLSSMGFDLRVEGIYGDGGWTVMDTESALGTNLNIKPSFDWAQF